MSEDWRCAFRGGLNLAQRCMLRAAHPRDHQWEPPPCCSMHNRNCEPPSELCCERCSEYHHGPHLCTHPGREKFVQVLLSHGGPNCLPCSVPDLSPNTLEEFVAHERTIADVHTMLAQAWNEQWGQMSLTRADIDLLLIALAPPTLSSVAQDAQKVAALGNNYPTIMMHPRHAARLWAEKTFEHIAPLTPDDSLDLDTIVIMRTSPVSLEKTEAFEAAQAAERIAATDYAELRSPEPI